MKKGLTTIWEDVKQLRYPEEFRIAPSAWPPQLLGDLEETARMLQSLLQEKEGDSQDRQEVEKLLAVVGTGLWRARKKMLVMAKRDSSQDLRVAIWAIESTWDMINQVGVEVQDHDSEIITGGEALHVLAFEPSEQCTRETVIETLKPTVYYQDKMIQAGEVIVGTPLKNQQ